MNAFLRRTCLVAFTSCALSGCSKEERTAPFVPSEVIDLGARITADLPERVWGRAFLEQMGFTEPNSFRVIEWTFPMEGAEVSGSNAYYTLFNHGGPHLDAPNHFGLGGGLDTYPVESLSGPAKVFDISEYPPGRSAPVETFEGSVDPGDVVLLATRYVAPQSDDAFPQIRTITNEAAQYLAALPIRAIGTDAFSIEDLGDVSMPSLHHEFLGRGIPLYESLFNVDGLLGKERMYFTGVPLNVPDADGMIVRPVVFVY